MVYLEWLLSNAFTLTTYYLWYIDSHCYFSLLEYYEQRICATLLTIMIIDAKLLYYIISHDLTWNGLDMFPNYDQNVCLFELVYGPFCLHFRGDFVFYSLPCITTQGWRPMFATVCLLLNNTYHASDYYYYWQSTSFVSTVIVNSAIRPGHRGTPSLLCYRFHYRFQFSSSILLLHFRHWPG